MAEEPKKIELQDEELIEEMEKLEDAVRQSTVPPSKQIVRGFFTGIASSLGAIVAVVIVVPLLLYLLKNVQWVPLIGNFAQSVSDYMQSRGR